MLTREEYEKEFIRMMDSKRVLFKKYNSCDGVICPNCPLNEECNSTPVNPFNIIAIVEQWSKDHPIEHCEDCISREAVLKLFVTHDRKSLYEAIEDMPSVR